MLNISQSYERQATPPVIEHTVEKSGWYHGREMGMAFCRVTEQLSAQPGSKSEKELRSLEGVLHRDLVKICRRRGVNLIDLGTGDGQKILLVINALTEAGIRDLRYVPVDTNRHIALYAILTVLGRGKKNWSRQEAQLLLGPAGNPHLATMGATDTLSTEALVCMTNTHSVRADLFHKNDVSVPTRGLDVDFFEELPSLVSETRGGDAEGMNLFCMLGNTFGNYSPPKRERFLNTLHGEMEADELLLLGVGLRPQSDPSCPDEIQLLRKEYLPGEVFLRMGADNPKSTYRLEYDQASSCMLHSFERPDTSRQDMGYSHLFDEAELIRDLVAAQFEIVSSESYPRRQNAGDAGDAKDAELPRSGANVPKHLTVLARKRPVVAERNGHDEP